MDILGDVRGAVAVVGALLALVVVGIVVARRWRSRASRTPPPMPMPMPEPPTVGSDAAYLDSSHIIGGPLSGGAEGRAEVAGGRAANRGDAAKPAGRDPGPRQ